MTRICCCLPVPRSLAPTWTMPLASMSKVTSICGTPRGAGGMPTSSKRARVLLSAAISRSPWSTWTDTSGWLSTAVEKTCAFLQGMVVFLSMMLGEDAAGRLDAQRERRDVEQEDVLHLALQHAALDGGADRHHLVGVDALVRLLAEELLHHLLHHGHAGHAAHQDDGVELRGGEAGVLERDLAGLDGLLDQVAHQLLERGPVDGLGQVLGAGGVGGDEGQVDLGLGGADESSCLARSAASLSRCSAMRSLRRSMPVWSWKRLASQSMIRWSKSSPPRKVSPLVAFTSKTPWSSSRMEMSKVPPPRS